MSKMNSTKRSVANKVDLDFAELEEEMGRLRFRRMEDAYGDWVGNEMVRGKESPYIVMGNDGKAHSCRSWEMVYVNDTPANHELFIRKYLVEHNMESLEALLGGDREVL